MPLIICAPKRKTITEILDELYDQYWPSVVSLNHGGSPSAILEDAGPSATNTNVMPTFQSDAPYLHFLSGTSYISVPDSEDFNFGTGDVTIEAEVCWDGTMPASKQSTLWGQNLGTAATLRVSLLSTGDLRVFPEKDTVYFSSTTRLQKNQWTHIAVTRQGDTITLFIAGQPAGSMSYASAIPNPAAPWVFGNEEMAALSYVFKGGMRNMRITKGVARYTAAFEPATPVLNSGDQYWNNVVFASDLSTGVLDAKGKTVTVGAGALLVPAPKFTPGSALYFNGSARFTEPATDYVFGTNDFTMECWVNTKTAATNSAIACQYGAAVNIAGGWAFRADASKVGFIYWNGSSYVELNGTIAINDGAWHHVAAVRKGTTLMVFADGTLCGVATISASQSIGNIGYPISYGVNANTSTYFDGFIQDLRITKDVARYDAQFSATTAPNVMDQYTKLLMHMDSAECVDDAGHAVTVSGSVFNTGNKIVGVGSAYFPGSGAQLRVAHRADLDVGSSDFTLEAWINPSSVSGGRAIIVKRTSTLYNSPYYFYSSGSTMYVRYTNSAGTTYTLNVGTLVVGQWHHVAMTRIGNTLVGFFNGKITASTAVSGSALSNTVAISIGCELDTSQDFAGYIDEVRLSVIARYPQPFFVAQKSYPDHRQADFAWDSTVLCMSMNTLQDAKGHVARTSGAVGLAEIGGLPVLTLKAEQDGAVIIDNSVDFNLTGPDCTIEMRVWLPQGYGFTYLLGQSSVGNDGNWFTYVYSDGRVCIGRTGVNEIASPAGIFKAGQWNHLAYVKKSGTMYVYYNGVQVASSSTVVFNASSADLRLLYRGNGYPTPVGAALDEVRITKGLARYQTAFTVPTRLPNAPVYDLYSKYLKLRTQFNNNLTDDANNYTLSGSGYAFNTDGIGGQPSLRLTSGNVSMTGSAFNAGPNDFTIERWFKPDASCPTCYAVSNATGFTSNAWMLEPTHGTYSDKWSFWVYNVSTSAPILVSTSPALGVWSHVAIVRRGNLITMYVNGVAQATKTLTSPTQSLSTAAADQIMYLGQHPTNRYSGNICQLNFYNVAKYRGNFVPPINQLPIKV